MATGDMKQVSEFIRLAAETGYRSSQAMILQLTLLASMENA